MSNILGSWSKMRKYLEEEMLADSLKGRIRYGCTSYVGMDGCCVFELYIDKKQFKRFSLETVNTYFIENGYKVNNDHYWNKFWFLLNKIPVTERSEYTDEEFCKALEVYRNEDIQKSAVSENPLIVMFSILDRRVGKRTLEKTKDRISTYPNWLGELLKLRTEAEKAS